MGVMIANSFGSSDTTLISGRQPGVLANFL
jgi:hypothetical protein